MDPQQPPESAPAPIPAAPPPPQAAPGPAMPPAGTPAPVASAPSAWVSDPAPTGPAPGVEFAGYGARLIAYLLDGLLLSVVILAIWLVLGVVLVGASSGDGEAGGAAVAVMVIVLGASVLISLLYFPYFWQRSGTTPGMSVFKIKVVRDRDGGPVTWGSAILRYIGFIIDTIVFGIPIGFLWVFFDKRRRAWHDLIGGTVVVKA